MTKLFIIGNGFDLSHGLKTSYNDFRNHLIREKVIESDILIRPSPRYLPDGGVDYDEDAVLSMLFYLISQAEPDPKAWRNVEAALANLNYDDLFDVDDVIDKEGDVDLSKTARVYEDIAIDLVSPLTSIQDLFSDWVHTISIEPDIEKTAVTELMDINDFYLTFNYTETLEEVYMIPDSRICYIHGRRFEPIYFGHGDIEDRTDEFMAYYLGAENYLLEIHELLRKKTEDALKSNSCFFQSLSSSNITEVYSYGFSYSEVDLVYMEEICNRIDTSEVTWYFNDHDSECHEQYRSLLLSSGFKGEFDTFNIPK